MNMPDSPDASEASHPQLWEEQQVAAPPTKKKKRHRELLTKHHPDKEGGNAEIIKLVYDVKEIFCPKIVGSVAKTCAHVFDRVRLPCCCCKSKKCVCSI